MGRTSQKLQQDCHQAHCPIVPKLILGRVPRTGSHQDFSHLLELNIGLGLEQGIEAGRGLDLFRVDRDDPVAVSLHVACRGSEDLTLRVIDHQRTFGFGAGENIWDDVAGRLSSSDAGDDAHILEALPLRKMPPGSVQQQAGVSARQESRGFAATQEPCPVLRLPEFSKEEGIANSSDEPHQAAWMGALYISVCASHGRIFFDVNVARGAGSGSSNPRAFLERPV